MSVLGEYPEAINNKDDLQIWNNSAFDDGDGDGDGDVAERFNSCNQIKSPSWLMKKQLPVNLSSDSSFSSKENRSPIGFSNSSVLVQPTKLCKNQLSKIDALKSDAVGENVEKTDEEIEIENEISRLYAKLESIRRERAEKNAANDVQKQGKSVLKIQESRNKIQRRGFSLGPNEIMSATNSRSKQSGVTPIQSNSNRRKSCFWKLDDIEEEKCGISRSKNHPSLRHAITTIGSKKGVKKDDLILGSIQPKKLFGDHSVPAKKPVKPGRVVPSRYNQATVNSSMKKRDNIEQKMNSGKVKKKWEIPSVIVIPKRLNLDENEGAVDVVMPEVLLPRIRVARCVEESGRDSGPAKRVAELVGKKSYFDEEEEICQKLSFDEV